MKALKLLKARRDSMLQWYGEDAKDLLGVRELDGAIAELEGFIPKRGVVFISLYLGAVLGILGTSLFLGYKLGEARTSLDDCKTERDRYNSTVDGLVLNGWSDARVQQFIDYGCVPYFEHVGGDK